MNVIVNGIAMIRYIIIITMCDVQQSAVRHVCVSIVVCIQPILPTM